MNASSVTNTDQAAQILEQLQNPADTLELALDDSILPLTHLHKPLWVGLGQQADASVITKRQLILYYLTVAPHLLPYVQDRPITFKRYPQGITGESFIQRHIDQPPDFVQTVEMYSDAAGGNRQFLLCQNLASLLWLAEMDAIELHPWFSRVNPTGTKLPSIFINSTGTLEMSVLNYPDYLVFDLDPSHQSTDSRIDVVAPPAAEPAPDQAKASSKQAFDQARQAAQVLHQVLLDLSLESFIKLSGKSGIHVLVPIERKYPFDKVRSAARKIGERLAEEHPDQFTTEWQVTKRQGKIFFDFNQNSRSKSLVAPYSLRPTMQATISWPINWKDLDTVYPDQFRLEMVLDQPDFINRNDPWKSILRKPQELPEELLV